MIIQPSTIILLDSTSPNTRDAVESAARAAERGALLHADNNRHAEIINIANLDDVVRNDNLLWNRIFHANGLVLCYSVDEGGRISEEMRRFLRLSEGAIMNYNRICRVSALVVHEPRSCICCRNCICNQSTPMDWARRNNLIWTMDSSLNITNDFINRDMMHWRDVATTVGESVIM